MPFPHQPRRAFSPVHAPISLLKKNTTKEQRKANSHYHCCCCCCSAAAAAAAARSYVLMVLLGCGQPWFVILSASPALVLFNPYAFLPLYFCLRVLACVCLHVSLLSVLLPPRISRFASSSSSHCHCCCCCCCCCCSCVLMVLLRCGQPWCMTSSAPHAHLLAAKLL